MYQVQDSVALLRARRGFAAARKTGRPLVARTVLLLGLTSLFTDISSEMVSAVLPLWLVANRGLDPLQFGVINGIYQGGSAVARILFGFVADKLHRYREVAGFGYGLSALCKLGLLLTSAFSGISAFILLDRIGKGIRTAPRDAMISLSSAKEDLGTAFGVHRAMDTCGAMLGPLVAFGLLALSPRGFHGVFLVSFCFALIGLAFLLLIQDSWRDAERGPTDVTSRSERARAAADSRLTFRGASALLRATPLGALVLVAFVLGVATIGDAFIYLQLHERLSFDSSLFPLLYVGTSAIYMVLAVPAGRFSDRIGRAKVFTFGYAVLLGIYAMLLSGAHGSMLLPLTLAGLGIFYASTDGILAALGSAMVPDALRGTGLAVLGAATGVAQFAASIAFGGLWVAVGVHTAFVVFTAGLAVALALTAALLLRPRSTCTTA
ncbi:MAG: transporter [Conexibacter sp.]|nr:transporter [Conexibacter sp.]